MVNATYMESLKYTDKASFTLKVKDLLQLQADAHRAGREPKMVVEFSTFGITAHITLED